MTTKLQRVNEIVTYYSANPDLQIIRDREYIVNGQRKKSSPVNLVVRRGNEWARLIKVFEFDSAELSGMTELEQRDYIRQQCLHLPNAAELEQEQFGSQNVSAELCFYNTPESILHNVPALLSFNGLEKRIYHDGTHVTSRVLEIDPSMLRSQVNGRPIKSGPRDGRRAIGSSHRQYIGGGDVK